MKRGVKIALGVVAGLVLIQMLPMARTNPPVTHDLEAPPEVKQALRRACYDCHSNETVWPWYARVAPASWLVHRDVVEGRKHLNFSEWGTLPPDKRAKKQRAAGKEVAEGEMPPWFYLPLHREARLSDIDKQRIDAWAKSAPTSAAPNERREQDDD